MDDGGTFTYAEVPLTSNAGSWSLEGAEVYDTVYLVVGATSEDWNDDETFSYRYRMWVEDPNAGESGDSGEEDPGKTGGCKGAPPLACATGSASNARFALLALALALAVRRRSYDPAPNTATSTPSPSSNVRVTTKGS